MRFLPRVFFLVGMLSASAFAEKEAKAPPAWVSQVPPPESGYFPLPKPVSLTYSAGWAGLVAGKVTCVFSTEKALENLHLTGGTVGPARLLYRLDTDSSSTCRQKTFAPVRADIQETYADEQRRTLQTFTSTEATRVRTCIPPRKDDGLERKIALPHLFDLQGSLLYVRSQRLLPGDEITLLACATDSPYLAKVRVLAREDITVRAGKYPALKLKLDLQSMDKKLALRPYKKAKNITAWISDDENRYFLKFTADLLIGTVFVELEQVDAPDVSAHQD